MACWLLTFLVVCLSWVLFRADSLSTAIDLYGAMFGAHGTSSRAFAGLEVPYKQAQFYHLLLAALVISVATPTAPVVARTVVQWVQGLRFSRLGTVASALFLGGLLGWCVERFGRHSPFLYFQF